MKNIFLICFVCIGFFAGCGTDKPLTREECNKQAIDILAKANNDNKAETEAAIKELDQKCSQASVSMSSSSLQKNKADDEPMNKKLE